MGDLHETSDVEFQTLDSLFPEGRIRLAELTVFNWGTFSGMHTGRIDENGTLVTGETGAGKSTFIDAHQLLMMQPGRTRFNAAAAGDDKRDRTLISYLRGMVGSTEDSGGRTTPRYKRKGATLTGVRGLYRSDAGSEVTLCSLFWVSASGTSNADVKHVYVLAMRNVSMADLVRGLLGMDGSPSHASLEAKFEGDGKVGVYRSWSEYEVRWRDALWIHNERGPALLARAMGLKKIDDLTELVREMVLEPPETAAKAQEAIAGFENLEAIHADLEDATERFELLQPLIEAETDHNNALFQLQQRAQESEVVESYFASERVRLAGDRLVRLDRQLTEQEERLAGLASQIEQTDHARRQADLVYEGAGGRALNNLKEDEVLAEKRLLRTSQASTIFDHLLHDLALARHGGRIVGVHEVTESGDVEALPTLEQLLEAKQRARDELQILSNSKEALTAEWGTALLTKQETTLKIEAARRQLESLQNKPDSAMPLEYHEVRERMSADTQISVGRLPFLAELIDVRQEDAVWRGAIERALGGMRFNFLVDEEIRPDVFKWLNDHYTGLLITVDTIRADRAHTDFAPRSFLRKLVWKEGPLRDGLKRLLVEHSLDCVDSKDEMSATPYSMTKEGGIHLKRGKFRKDDRRSLDKGWVLGFSSMAQQKRLQEEITDLVGEFNRNSAACARAGDAVQVADKRSDSAQKLLKIEFEDIDIADAHAELLRIRNQIDDLKRDAVDMVAAKDAVDAIVAKLKELRKVELHENGVKTTLELVRTQAETESREQQARVRSSANADALLRVAAAFGTLTESDNAEERERTAKQSANSSVSTARTAINRIATDCSRIIAIYKEKYVAHAASLPDWKQAEGPEALQVKLRDWTAYIDVLQKDRLHGLNERWRELLDNHASKSLRLVQESMRAQVEAIEDGIDNVNSVLGKTAFKANSYLQVIPEAIQIPEATKLDFALSAALRSSIVGDSKAHYNAIKAAIEELRKAIDTTRSKATMSMLDARYRYRFAAEEKDRETHAQIDILRGTGGKSGGEKESFSGSIVAAALAYVLTEQGGSRPSYCTVFLDEAFSNTSDGVARRVLGIFKQLGLHINLITPFKNIELARHAVSSAIIVEQDSLGESHLAPISWEEIDRRTLDSGSDSEAVREAHRLGVQVETVSWLGQ